ncbi:MAG TPA: helix-turn-helix domain-containing protein [Bryobacteraceae bacterium]|jgi:AcrR family transcriptional regulator
MADSEGLRERKKQRTRQTIASAAARLFEKRGFENVRMIDIAAAADVSEQTLYNYFPSKEHLIFDRDQEFEQQIIDIVIGRKTSIADAVRTGVLDFLEQASRSLGKTSGIPESVATGPALRRVWIEMNARHADHLAEHLVAGGMHKASAKLLSRSIVAMFAVTLEEIGEAAIAGKSRSVLLRELRPILESAAKQFDVY